MKKYLFTIMFIVAWALFILIVADNNENWMVIVLSFCIGLLMVIPIGLIVDYHKAEDSKDELSECDYWDGDESNKFLM